MIKMVRIRDIPKTERGRKAEIQRIKKRIAKDKKKMAQLIEYSKIEEMRVRRGYKLVRFMRRKRPDEKGPFWVEVPYKSPVKKK